MAFVCALVWQDFSGSIPSQYLQLNVKCNRKTKLQVGILDGLTTILFFYFHKLFENDALRNHTACFGIYQRKEEKNTCVDTEKKLYITLQTKLYSNYILTLYKVDMQCIRKIYLSMVKIHVSPGRIVHVQAGSRFSCV